MIDVQTLSNLLAFSAQAACIIGLAGVLSWLLRIDAAGARYTYWRGVLAFCLVLPWLQGRAPAPAAGVAPADPGLSLPIVASVAPVMAEAPAAGLPWLTLLGALIVGGMVLRAMWIGAALVSLRRLRAAGVPASLEHEALQQDLGTRAEIRYVRDLGQPVTFGVRRPIVLLPDRLREHPPEVQRAVVCHELFHVQRRDWLWLMAEELIRAVFWFHPAIYWLVSRIQLAREEVVDELTVMATHKRRAYIQALMAFADDTPAAATAAFSRRNHLFRRIVLVSREAVMSARRVVLSCALMALMVGSGGWLATEVFPLVQAAAAQELLTEPGPLEQEANPLTPENPIPRRIFSVAAYYPPEGLASSARATVALRITLDERGSIAEVRRLRVAVNTSSAGGGRVALALGALNDAFAGAAAEAVRQWQYEPPVNAPIAFDVAFAFSPDAAEATSAQLPGGSAPAQGGASAGPGGAAVGPGLTTGDLPSDWPVAPVRIGGNIREPGRIRHVSPVYPQIAQQARVSGVVILELVIAPEGYVAQARVLRSIPLLDRAALDAVMQWEFTPTILNGTAVPVIMTVTVNFTLAPLAPPQ